MPLCRAITEHRERRTRHRELERDLAVFTSPAELSELEALIEAGAAGPDTDEVRDILYQQAMVRLIEPRRMHLFRTN
jgi:DNA-binding transcriptional regulator of glucitol operon